MGFLEAVAGPLGSQVAQRGTAVVIASGFVAFLVVTVILNVLKQLLFKNPNEPPVVFHWFPVVGNTVMYGMDPYRFFFQCREKVSLFLPRVCMEWVGMGGCEWGWGEDGG